MIKKYAVILLAGLMLIGCSSQSNVKASKEKTSKEVSEINDPADVIYETDKTKNPKHKQTVILEIESK
ncbi:hypothetical protein AKG34_17180 [Peribacillus butanolivorans]|uniref:hypothetical protein n=1 Tax=Peribacillus butanolivorans TaxID=421767 RepID=UPI0006A73D17|nr:hypothetical protein [Peribacillus butanolivorans]KON70320.1 hypothetical protein AKG34_17180 [Peribacillus butanolivorans]MED3687822.1 hypothetical protein [Peribacillus butanolivorans]